MIKIKALTIVVDSRLEVSRSFFGVPHSDLASAERRAPSSAPTGLHFANTSADITWSRVDAALARLLTSTILRIKNRPGRKAVSAADCQVRTMPRTWWVSLEQNGIVAVNGHRFVCAERDLREILHGVASSEAHAYQERWRDSFPFSRPDLKFLPFRLQAAGARATPGTSLKRQDTRVDLSRLEVRDIPCL